MAEHPGFRGDEGAHTVEPEASATGEGGGASLADWFAPAAPGDKETAEAASGSVQQGDEDRTRLRQQVQQVIDELRPYIQMDGGDIELVDITPDGVVQVRMHGACVGCSASIYTLQLGVEQRLKEALPEIRYVEAVP